MLARARDEINANNCDANFICHFLTFGPDVRGDYISLVRLEVSSMINPLQHFGNSGSV
jgi:hypothetical protein